ncbi:hypothetical protein F8M41_016346 [Gigaspora margarita]|uniref:Uncharacterized protein n=1 Tax=Gigaspora margarita TaxID=4874 RepID=A0A8H4EMN6_GIGMA|nr:hypothetical protein F8M41_016346 [Gigaspora margarita]
MFKNNKNHYKYIHAQLPDGSAIDINLNVLDKNVTIIFLVTMQYYFLLYDQNFNGNMQITGIVLEYNEQIVKEYSIDNWNIFSLDLPISRNDFGYENLNIVSTYPKTNESNQKYADTAIGTIWLTLGDDIKNNLISNILNNLTKELAESIPINPERLQQTNQFQNDLSTSPPQYVIQLKILSTMDYCQLTFLKSLII